MKERARAKAREQRAVERDREATGLRRDLLELVEITPPVDGSTLDEHPLVAFGRFEALTRIEVAIAEREARAAEAMLRRVAELLAQAASALRNPDAWDADGVVADADRALEALGWSRAELVVQDVAAPPSRAEKLAGRIPGWQNDDDG